jgi:hypothetical protein
MLFFSLLQSSHVDPEELFTKLDRIGKGSFGEVCISSYFTHMLYALPQYLLYPPLTLGGYARP